MSSASGDKSDLPSLSVRRPLLMLVFNLLIIIFGICAYFGVEVRELPDVDYPVVSVLARYPGASPETMDAEVTRIVEGAVARVSGVKHIRSASEENNMRIHAEFLPSVDLDTAAADVREAISRVTRKVPDAVEEISIIKADQDARPIIRLVAHSATLAEDELTRVVETDIVPELISIEGVADVQLFGDRERQLHVVLDPMRLTSYALSVGDIATVLRTAPLDIPTGSFRTEDQEIVVRVNASAVTEGAVKNLVIRDDIRIADVAETFFGPADAVSLTRLDGLPVIGMGIIRQAGSNSVAISEGVERALKILAPRFADVDLMVVSDDAVFIRGSIREVTICLLISVFVVVSTVWLFLGSGRMALVPCVTIPVALIGAVAGIWLVGYSINILTLLGLVLATGLIVDDAIVVIENIQRRHGQGLPPGAAAVLGTRQVFFAVIATTAVLVAVFIPIAFLPSMAGRLFREFGFVLAFAVALSSFVALSVVPALAARLLRNAPAERKDADRLRDLGRRLQELYEQSLNQVLGHPKPVILASITIGAVGFLLYFFLPQNLLPREDRGQIEIRLTGPDGVGLGYVDRQVSEAERLLAPYVGDDGIANVLSVVGRFDPNRASISAPLVPWDERDLSQQDLIARLAPEISRIPGARISIFGPNSLNLYDSGDQLEIALVGSDYGAIYEAAKVFARQVEDRIDYLSDPDLSYQPTQPQISLEVDRRRAAELGIPVNELNQTLRAMIGGFEVVDLNVTDTAIPIVLESSVRDIDDPSDLANLYITTDDGHSISLASLVTVKEEGIAAQLDRHAQRRAIEIDFKLEPGVTLGRAAEDVRNLIAGEAKLPDGIGLILLGEARDLDETTHDVALTYGMALAVVFLVLVAQFESWTSALVVMATVPFGVVTAIYVLLLSGVGLNIYSQIGLIMLIGLMAKNGVLLVEFADQLRDQGMGVRDAIAKAAVIRLRPITMTIASTALGALPLVLAAGPGAEARSAIGWVVFGGVGLATAFTLYFTPIVYLGIARFSRPRADAAATLQGELERAQAVPKDVY